MREIWGESVGNCGSDAGGVPERIFPKETYGKGEKTISCRAELFPAFWIAW